MIKFKGLVFSSVSSLSHQSRTELRRFSFGFQFSSTNFANELNEIIDIDAPKKPKGRLLIIPTPIGNLQDLSIRQYEYLLEADVIACEDTRVTGKLFKMLKDGRIRDRFYSDFDIQLPDIADQETNDETLKEEEEIFDKATRKARKAAAKKLDDLDSLSFLGKEDNDDEIDPQGLYGISNEGILYLKQSIAQNRKKKGRGLLISYYQHNEEQRITKLINLMRYGICVGLVSDAGTPTVSDPGYRLVDKCIKEDISVDALPGPNAISVALSLSGFPSDRYLFEGYSSKTSSLKVEKLERIKGMELTAVMFESNARIMKTLLTIEKIFGEKQQVFVAFELTKLHQNTIRSPVREVFERLRTTEDISRIKGEITIVIPPYLPNYNLDLLEKAKESEEASPEKKELLEEENKIYQIKSKELIALLDDKLQASSDKGLSNLVADILNISKGKAMNLVKEYRHEHKKTIGQKVFKILNESK